MALSFTSRNHSASTSPPGRQIRISDEQERVFHEAHTVLFCPDNLLAPEHLPEHMREGQLSQLKCDIPSYLTLEEIERKAIEQTLERTGGNITKTAQILDLHRPSSKFKAEPGWTFVTGSKTDIDHLLKSLGAYVGDKVNHTPMVLVGNDKAGYWTRAYGLSPASTLVKAIREAAGKDGALEVPMPGAAAAERMVHRRVAANEAAGEAKKMKTPAEAARGSSQIEWPRIEPQTAD